MEGSPEGPKSGCRNVVELSMLASQVALFGSTGKPEMLVFHALSAGNIGQSVPGSVVPLGAGLLSGTVRN